MPRDAHAEAGQAALGVGRAQAERARGAGVTEPAPHVGLRQRGMGVMGRLWGVSGGTGENWTSLALGGG